jgi:hypothetical protein
LGTPDIGALLGSSQVTRQRLKSLLRTKEDNDFSRDVEHPPHPPHPPHLPHPLVINPISLFDMDPKKPSVLRSVLSLSLFVVLAIAVGLLTANFVFALIEKLG